MSKENEAGYNDLIDPEDQMPDVSENGDGTVSMGIEEETQDEPEPEEEPAEPVEDDSTPEPPEEPEEPTLHPFEQAFKDAGLERQYPGGVEEMIRRIPDTNKFLTELSQQNAALKRQLQELATNKGEPPSINFDELAENPVNTLDSRYVTKDDFANISRSIEQMQVDNFIVNHKDFDQMREPMARVLTQFPELERMPTARALQVIYDIAKAKQIPELVNKASSVKPEVPNKTSAQVDTKGKKGGPTEPSASDLLKMSNKQLEEHLGFVADE